MGQSLEAIEPSVDRMEPCAHEPLPGPVELWWDADDFNSARAWEISTDAISTSPGPDNVDVPAAPKAPALLWIVDADVSDALQPKPQTAAPNAAPGITVSSNITFVSDYRVAGVSSSGRGGALQGEADVDAHNGWTAGIWASNISKTAGSNVEVDLYGAKSIDVGDTEFNVGATIIVLPGGDNASVGMATGGVSKPMGPIDASLSIRYVWPGQGNVGYHDDFYVSLKVKTPIGRVMGAPLTLAASVGYEDGVFVVEDKKTDWSLSLTAHVGHFDLGVSYVDTSLRRDRTGAAGCIFSLVRNF